MPKLSVPDIKRLKSKGKPIVCVSAYDAPTARLAEQAGVDIILVGDSVGMAMLGMKSTLEVSMDDMLHHGRAVVRGAPDTHVIIDMPFMSYQSSDDDAMRNAGRALSDAHATSIKLEGGARLAPLVSRLVDAGIPVMGHIGLKPQSVNLLGGYPAQGTDAASADAVIEDAEQLAKAGVFAMVLERVPIELSKYITDCVPVPTIGIGSGPHCDGQVLVLHDMLGMDDRFQPKHSKPYASLAGTIREAITHYAADVREQRFPETQNAVKASAELLAHLKSRALIPS